MPPDALLAPTQVYIILAITVATFSWLLRPESMAQLSGWEVAVCACVVGYQSLHLLLFTSIHENYPWANVAAHGIAVASYLIMAAWLFSKRWIESKTTPPSSPHEVD